jgi:hypothetical protein
MIAPTKGESVPEDGQRNGHGSSSSLSLRIELVPLDGSGGVRGAILTMHAHEEQAK